MAKTAAVEVQAGDRTVRISSPDRVIYEATGKTPEVTKQMVAEYVVSVADGHVLVDVVYDDGSLQAWADQTYGSDVVIVTGALVDA